MCAAEISDESEDTSHDSSLLEDVKQLLMEFGDSADNVAARRADKLFRDGDFVALLEARAG